MEVSDAEILAESILVPARFSVLYRRHRRAVIRYAARRLGNELAEDLTAEVFVRAFRARERYHAQHQTALPWLLGIATHLIADHRRRERRRLAALSRLLVDPPAAIEPGSSELAPELVRELRRLPAADRDTLLLAVWGELSYEETASALGIPIGTVRSRIARARSRLAAAIGTPERSPHATVNGEANA